MSLIINKYEYEFLTRHPNMVKFGAALAAVYEFCQENGLIACDGTITQAGENQIKLYEEKHGTERS